MRERARNTALVTALAGALAGMGCTTSSGPPPSEALPIPYPAPAPPAPPPPVSAPAADGGGYEGAEDIVVTGSRVDGASRPRRESRRDRAEAASASTFAPPGRGGQGRQAGVLTAGDYDDLLNPTFYAGYVSRALQQQGGRRLPYVDTTQRVTVAVTGRGGRPVPFAHVRVRRPSGPDLDLRTATDGTVVLFPALDRLGDTSRVTVSVPNGPSLTRPLVVSEGASRLEVVVDAQAAAPHAFDLLMVVDATGSMTDEMEYLKAEISSIMAGLADSHPGMDTRIGLIVYRDVGDAYVVREFPFTGDVQQVRAQLAEQRADGGGDTPEAVDQAMKRAMAYPWREDAVKALVLVADAPPHDDRIEATWAEALTARERRIHIVPVAASGVDDSAEFLMRAMAAVTQSRYVFLTDDSGVGLPHADPEVKCYQVTRLDGLLRRVLDSLISGRRVEPSEREVIRRVGPYREGVCETDRQRRPQ
ncbi:MAG TPA: vWA domain-containing protein [Caulobacteraceae bacterium]